jgi:predicted secreted Zn-dependent protease
MLIILSHEQLHFDISELFARKMKRSIDRHHFSSEVKSEIREIYLEIIEEMRAFQNRYDQETNYSRSVEKQEEWNRMIAAALRENRD